MGQRLELQEILESFLPKGKRAYFQPPENVKLDYPCIVYNRENQDVKFADNKPYRNTTRYSVTVIDLDPDGDIRDKVAQLPMCTHNRFYQADNLNHDVFRLYF